MSNFICYVSIIVCIFLSMCSYVVLLNGSDKEGCERYGVLFS